MCCEMLPLSPAEKILTDHDIESFDCGKTELNRFLNRFAFANHLLPAVDYKLQRKVA